MDNMLREMIQSKKIAIYGTGHVAKKFYLALKERGLDKKVDKCIVSSNKNRENRWLDNISVQVLEEVSIEPGEIICIAVHYSLKDEIVHNLEKKGYRNYIWIYPYLYEMLLGNPAFRNEKVSIDKIMNTCKDDYRMAVRTLVIDQFFGKNDCGYDFYIRLQMLHCQRRTAQKRLDAFIQLIQSWETRGYETDSVILINQNYEIIDGNHRVALANYFNYKEIYCNLYEMDISVLDVHGENAMITKATLYKAGFSEKEIRVLDEVLERL